jgi:UDP-N-acetylmuramyl pentapeptide synthase
MKKKTIETSFSKLTLPKGRLNQLKGRNNSLLLDDTYNANPQSTIFALQELVGMTKGSGRRIAIIGDMLELGDFEKDGHKAVANKINELEIDMVVTVGKLGKIIFDNINIEQKFHLDQANEMKELLNEDVFSLQKNDVVLLKGSQGVRMERITKLLMKNPEKAPDLLVRQDARWL